MTSKTWFITGASSGLGREWALAALERGDRVVLAARRTHRLTEMADRFGDQALAVTVDVTDRSAAFAAVAHAVRHFGHLDVVVNCAGGGHSGAVEELTEDEARRNVDLNFFGSLWVTQASLPFLRSRKRGHIVMVSSVGGLTGIPSLGIYCASKWALEGLTEALAAEVGRFGVKVTILEPARYLTDSATRSRSALHPAYAAEHEAVEQRAAAVAAAGGDPAATREAILRVVDSDEPPARLLLGAGTVTLLHDLYDSRLAAWRSWADLSTRAQGAPHPPVP